MACFLVPVAEAVITTIARRTIKSKEKAAEVSFSDTEAVSKIKLSTKLGWLNKLLWGGSALLAFEHVWHGEIVPAFPFLTAVQTGETAEMLSEMTSAGVLMAALITAVWCGMVAVVSVMEKKAVKEAKEVKAGA